MYSIEYSEAYFDIDKLRMLMFILKWCICDEMIFLCLYFHNPLQIDIKYLFGANCENNYTLSLFSLKRFFISNKISIIIYLKAFHQKAFKSNK